MKVSLVCYSSAHSLDLWKRAIGLSIPNIQNVRSCSVSHTMVQRLMSSYQVKQYPKKHSFEEGNRQKSLGVKSWPVALAHRFPDKIMKQVPSQLCRVPSVIFMEENYAIAQNTNAFVLMTCRKLFSVAQGWSALTLRSYSKTSISNTRRFAEDNDQHFASRWRHFKLLLPGWARVFPVHGWSLDGGSEIMEPCLITNTG